MASQALNATQIAFLTRFLGLSIPPASAGDDVLVAQIEGYLSTLPNDVRAMSQIDRGLAERLESELSAAQGLWDRGDPDAALRGLERVADALAVARGASRAVEAAATVPEGLVRERVRSLELALSEWRIGRVQAIDELSDLVAELVQEDDPDLIEIGAKIAALGRDIPNALQQALQRLRVAVDSGDEAQVAAMRTKAAKALSDAETYLKVNAADLRKCEDNPYGIAIDAVGAVTSAIHAVQKSLERI